MTTNEIIAVVKYSNALRDHFKTITYTFDAELVTAWFQNNYLIKKLEEGEANGNDANTNTNQAT